MVRRAIRVFLKQGPFVFGGRIVPFIYRWGLRPLLPATGSVLYSGVKTQYTKRWGDNITPASWRPFTDNDIPDYESTLVAALRERVESGDRVVVVGGGLGITTTVAAIQAGATGTVDCFEGASEGVEKVRRTALLNGVASRVSVHHAVVAQSISVYGTEPDQAVVPPSALPDCEVLELDCEGAEVDILRGMTIRPRVILVETHGLYGASAALVTSILENLGYNVADLGVAEPRVQQDCEEGDIKVLEAVWALSQSTG